MLKNDDPAKGRHNEQKRPEEDFGQHHSQSQYYKLGGSPSLCRPRLKMVPSDVKL
jgi:hypothetical protein